MWADNETSLDLINVQHLIGSVANVIRNQDLLPVTIGVYGGWGQGKSSLIQMIRQDLEKDDGLVCVTFNGWLFESYDDAKSALMGSILEKVAEERTLSAKAKHALKRLAGRIDWFRTMSLAGKGALTIAAGGLPGLSLATATEGVELTQSALKDEGGLEADGKDSAVQTVRGFREDFVKLLAETEISTLVVFIDELDRCLPTAVVETLEAIRLFLFVEGTAFVVGADEDLVRQAVNLRFESEGMKASVGGLYLEKMIQIPFRIPPMSPRAMRTYMNLLFTQAHIEKEQFRQLVAKIPEPTPTDFGEIRFDYEQASEILDTVPPELAENFGLTALMGDVLTQGLKGNPRQLKRFLNMLVLRLDLASRRGLELERRPLGKLMLLEYFHPQRFDELSSWRVTETGCVYLHQLEMVARAQLVAPDDVPDGEAEATGEDEGERESTGGDKVDLPEEAPVPSISSDLQAWLDDEQLVRWLQLEPALGKRDLRPYLYITREQTGALQLLPGDLSPKAGDVLRTLRSEAKAHRLQGESDAAELSQGESASIFRHLSGDIDRAEVLSSADEPPIASILHLTSARPELSTDLVALFRRIPPTRLPLGMVPALENRLKNSHPSELQSLFGKWSKATDQSPRFARAAEKALNRMSKGG